jgi:hypothetical protein
MVIMSMGDLKNIAEFLQEKLLITGTFQHKI